MTTEGALLQAVLAQSDDDLPRLVLADWLEEHGEGERAEFIRVQCEIARGPQCRWAGPGTKACGEHNERLPAYRVETWCEPCLRHRDLPQRERQLIADHWRAWVRPAPGHLSASWPAVVGGRTSTVEVDGTFFDFRRGFVAEVRGTLAALIGTDCDRCEATGMRTPPPESRPCRSCRGTGHTTGVLPALVRREPVERAEVTDREPYHNGGGYCWYDESRPLPQTGSHWANLPTELFRRLTRRPRWVPYPTPGAARDALSAALLAWAKAQPSG